MVLHFVLKEKDWEIIAWKNTLKLHEFNSYVRAAIAAERGKKIADLPVPKVLNKGLVYCDTKLYFNGREEAALIRTLPKGKRSTVIKKVLLKQIRANQKRLEDESKAVIPPVRQTVLPKPEIKENHDDDMSEEYRKMLNQMSGKA